MPKSFADKRDTFFKKRNLKRHPSIKKKQKKHRDLRNFIGTIALKQSFYMKNFIEAILNVLNNLCILLYLLIQKSLSAALKCYIYLFL